MNASKVVIAGAGVIAVIGALGFAYAQTSPDSKNVTDSLGRNVTSSFGRSPQNTSKRVTEETTTNSADRRRDNSAENSSSSTMDPRPTTQAVPGAIGATSGMTDNRESDNARSTNQTSGIADSGAAGIKDNGLPAASGSAASAAGGITGERIARADRN